MNTVTVLIEGYVNAIEGRQFIPGVAADGARHVAGTVVLIRGEQAIIVVDPGMVTDRALIVAALAKEGVSPQEVTHVFVSHYHPDHTVNIALFPNAEVVDFLGGVQRGPVARPRGWLCHCPRRYGAAHPGPHGRGCLARGGDRRRHVCADPSLVQTSSKFL